MGGEDGFTPRLGKIRALGSKRGSKYLHQVLRAVALAGGKRMSGKRRFSGSRIGRGAGAGRVLAGASYDALRGRRVIIKSRFVRIKAKGLQGARMHLRYIQRDGVTREGQPGELYSADQDQTDGAAFLKRGEADRHQFRFIVAAEDGDQYDDLKPFVRNLMSQMETDLDTKLDWVAVDHFNTGHPHTHIILRGADDKGRDLVIAREYLSHGMRARASEIVGLDLGPRTDQEIERDLRREVDLERLTSLDRRLLKSMDTERVVGPPHYPETPFQQSLRAGRLAKLARLGLAEEVKPSHWRLAEDLERTLRTMGERGDIIKTLNRELSARGRTPAASELTIYNPAAESARPLVGQVVTRGVADELNDRYYLIVDGSDGYSHYVAIGRGEDVASMTDGALVEITPKRASARDVDHTVAEIAAAHGGRYSPEIHLRHDRSATMAYAETHVRRLEAMRRLENSVERLPDGTWIIAADHVARAEAYEQGRISRAPVSIAVLSALNLEAQVGADGVTWLDHELTSAEPLPLREAGFGREAKAALNRRRQWLLSQELAVERSDGISVKGDAVSRLRQREVARVGAQLAKDLGLPFRDSSRDRSISGVYRKPVELVSGRFAVIARDKDFALVPWRPVLERGLGQHVIGVVRGDAISWTLGRGREVTR